MTSNRIKESILFPALGVFIGNFRRMQYTKKTITTHLVMRECNEQIPIIVREAKITFNIKSKKNEQYMTREKCLMFNSIRGGFYEG